MSFNSIRNLIRRTGYDIIRYPHLWQERELLNLFNKYNIELVLDIGANSGQFGSLLREIGFNGKILSFEPLNSAFELLKQTAGKYNNWECFNFGLGDRSGITEINIAANSWSSSFLDMTNTHISSAPDSKYTGKQSAKIEELDNIFEKLCGDKKTFLKIDTQGFEKKILEGGKESLKKILGIQLEMSFRELYKGETLFPEMIEYLRSKNFYLQSISSAFSDPVTGELLQVNGVFFKPHQ